VKERGIIGDEVRASHLQQHPFQLQQHIEEQKMGSFDVSGGTVTSSFEHSNLNDRERKGIPSGQPMGVGRLYDDTVNFLSHLRFGGGLNTPERSPKGGDH
jgi:hypothetical protein